MERSSLSNIISATRLLPHFSSQNINLMKSCIFEQLGCENESQFICKSLQSLYKQMSHESTSIIKNKAMEISDSQLIVDHDDMYNKKNNCNSNNVPGTIASNHRITVHKYVQQQYSDRLSKLNSDLINNLGSFLSKQKSIEFGYLNKQKQSYLLKRCKDKLMLDDNRINNLFWSQSIPYNYYLPNILHLGFIDLKLENMLKIGYFNNFFRGLNTLFLQLFIFVNCSM